MGIKYSIGRLTLGKAFEILIPEQLDQNDIGLLPISLSHINRIASMPLHHRDPFDRLLIAQSLVENIPVIGIDRAFDDYAVSRIW